MEGIINKIMEIDRLAEQKLAAAKKLQQQIAKEAVEESSKLEESLKKSADRAIDNVEATNRHEFEILSEKQEKKYADEMKRLDRFYEQEHEKIENEIFSRIVGELS